MNFEAVIGLEIHVEMKTKSKMFSHSLNSYSKQPNTNTTEYDFAFPGTMPTVNKQAVINAIRVCNALHMRIDHELWFDRKNYFYSDLPKGFQITQQARPIGSNGYVILDVNDEKVKVNIERLHIEEDTCKQLHLRDCTLLDYNRAGVPLIEIVSKPEIKNGTEAMKYVEKIRDIVIYSGVSDGKMEEGSLRCDVNVSIRPCGSDVFGTKVEIKNLNSTSNIQKAIDYEIKRQSNLLLKGEAIQQETRRYDEMKKETVLMRVKTDAIDYKYFTEPNIIPILLSDEFIFDAIDTCPELYDQKLIRYTSELNLSKYDAEVILANIENCKYFEEIIKNTNQYKLASNWLTVDIQSYLNKNNQSIKDFKISPKDIAILIEAISSNKISSKQAKAIFNNALNENGVIADLIKNSSNNLISDEGELLKLINETLDNNPQSIVDFKNGKDRAIGFLVGQIMKKTQGKANPSLTSKLLKQEIDKR